ncbi:MAG: ERAP1-like C-terminal domain-containing protein, partial [Patescibacteria group bacterium]
ELIKRALEFSISPAVRPQDTTFLIGRVFRNSGFRHLAWEFIKSDWTLLYGRFSKESGSGNLLSRLIGFMDGFATYAMADEIERFFREHPVPEALRTIEQVLEKIRARAYWFEREKFDIQKWFDKYRANPVR